MMLIQMKQIEPSTVTFIKKFQLIYSSLDCVYKMSELSSSSSCSIAAFAFVLVGDFFSIDSGNVNRMEQRDMIRRWLNKHLFFVLNPCSPYISI